MEESKKRKIVCIVRSHQNLSDDFCSVYKKKNINQLKQSDISDCFFAKQEEYYGKEER